MAFVEQTVPTLVANVIAFGRAAMPVFAAITGAIGDMTLFESFASVLEEALPLLAALGTMLVQVAGPLFRVSRGFLAAAVVIGSVLTLVVRFIGALGPLAEGLGVLVGILLAVVTAQQLLALTTGTLIARLFALATIKLQTALASKGYTVSTLAAAGATALLTAAVVALVGALTFGLAPALGAVGGQFSGVTSNIKQATRALKRFDGARGRMGGIGTPTPAGGGRRDTGYTTGSDITVVAPDRDTGMAVAHSANFHGDTDQSNVASRIHNGE